MTVTELIQRIKFDYGINQTLLARHIGVSPQILTDIKAGRRRFTPFMAEKIMELFAHEAGGGWLAAALDSILSENNADECQGKRIRQAYPAPRSSPVGMILPVLDAPCRGEPLDAPGYTGKMVMIPEALTHLVDDNSRAYILALDYDDYSGRLRAGDLVLIVQDIAYPKEIMIVDHKGRLVLARSVKSEASSAQNWVALDTGRLLENAVCAGAAIGIATAFL